MEPASPPPDVIESLRTASRVTGVGGRVTTDAAGLFRIGLQPGDYTLEPQPVAGLMGTAAAMPFPVGVDAETFLDIAYDTGIR